MQLVIFDILVGISAAAVYGVGFGAAAFMMDRLDILTGSLGVTGYAAFGLPIWPATLPALLTYHALYRTADEYREERMREAERRLDDAIADARRLTEGGNLYAVCDVVGTRRVVQFITRRRLHRHLGR